MSAVSEEAVEPSFHPGSALEVLRVFTRLGLTSFGGPIAHLGFFRTEVRRAPPLVR
jgi:chromate transporter